MYPIKDGIFFRIRKNILYCNQHPKKDVTNQKFFFPPELETCAPSFFLQNENKDQVRLYPKFY